jgi:RNA polymerase sigma-70 factor (ECF subfamily)
VNGTINIHNKKDQVDTTLKKMHDEYKREVYVHRTFLMNTAKNMTKTRMDAEDLVQDTLLKAYKYFYKYKRGTNCRAWLYKIMIYTNINNYRIRLKRPLFVGMGDENIFKDHSQVNPAEQCMLKVSYTRIMKNIERLPKEFRIVVVLALLDNFTYSQIARMIRIPIGTVKSRLYRGRRLLQQSLTGD